MLGSVRHVSALLVRACVPLLRSAVQCGPRVARLAEPRALPVDGVVATSADSADVYVISTYV